MPFSRSSGILLHPTSLPSRFGIGDLGPEARRFVDFLAASGQRLWQVLPLGPTGFGDSPYMCFSAMAGNPLLISLEVLRDRGLLDDSDLDALPSYPVAVDFGRVIREKSPLLRKAWSTFRETAGPEEKNAYAEFRQSTANWLDDFALFMALKEHYKGKPWVEWTKPLIKRAPAALSRAKVKHADIIDYHRFVQFEFHRQISDIKTYANQRHIHIVGDLPIYVAHDSAEVWAQPDYFDINQETGRPNAVAGVPPDYFSVTGQLWGNPLYNWDKLKADGYEWWVKRFVALLEYVDAVRIDHFRGFEAYWRVPYGEATAINGAWIKGPGEDLFKRMYERLGDLPIIAEDLGVITPEVEALRDGFNLPGMKILQFAFGSDDDNPYLPHNYRPNCVVYTGTHDNDTTQGWFLSIPEKERAIVMEYLKSENPESIAWDMLSLAFTSEAMMAIIPLQDLLGLGAEARMNTPSHGQGNWVWRFEKGCLTDALQEKLLALTEATDRRFVSVSEPAVKLA
jgi:4-alpha-glucanotransferase